MYFMSDDGIDDLITTLEAAILELGKDAVKTAFNGLSFTIAVNGEAVKIPGSRIDHLQKHEDPKVLLAIIEGPEPVRVALGNSHGEHVLNALIEMLAEAYIKDPTREDLRVYLRRKALKDLQI